MTDHLTPEQRHLVMSHIHGKGTKPELKVRQWLWRHGYRYRLNVKSVPGKPDIVMRKYRTAIFVNGCFWHGHGLPLPPPEGGGDESRSGTLEKEGGGGTPLSSGEGLGVRHCFRIPSTNQEFWVTKIRRNQERDQKNYQLLQENGWQVIVIWECQLKPKRIEQTMTEVELLLNNNFLSLHNKHTSVFYHTEEEHPLPMAAE